MSTDKGPAEQIKKHPYNKYAVVKRKEKCLYMLTLVLSLHILPGEKKYDGEECIQNAT